ncbi:MAG: TIM barrel protein [Treponema sp.]|jgi:sugar phosphate isomerase/epimerase|nr:TIM barrel protein [Treponema sp.]
MMGTISVPSWVIPGTYLENLRFLEDKNEVSGVELLFFIYDGEIKKMLDDEWEEILRYRERFVFTAHLPDRLLPGHRELIERLAPLSRHFIVHPGLPEDAPELAVLVNGWAAEFPRCRFLAENTGPGMIESLLPLLDKNVGLCMDTGHLLLEGTDPAAWFAGRRERTAEIHLHGVDRDRAALDGRLPDHRPIAAEAAWFKKLRPLLREFDGVINVEMFSWEEARESIAALIGKSEEKVCRIV